MKKIVKDLMIPISEYATVDKGATLFEAVLALEKVQEKNSKATKYKYRVVLVVDNNGKVVGKLNQLDVLRALELGKDQTAEIEDISKFGFSQKLVTDLMECSRLRNTSLNILCLKPAMMKVEDFMEVPSERQSVEEDTSLDVAIYQLMNGPFLSLMVLRENEIVGILRLTDIFLTVVNAMKENELNK